MLQPLACSLLQIDSQMETSCNISFEFVDHEQLVSGDYLQGPCASLCVPPRVGYMWAHEDIRILELDRCENSCMLNSKVPASGLGRLQGSGSLLFPFPG